VIDVLRKRYVSQLAALVATSLMPSVKWRAYGRTAGASTGIPRARDIK
jgi:hypothetical protein